MTQDNPTLFDRFLLPIFQFLIDGKSLEELYNKVDWEGQADHIRQPDLTYPDYYAGQNFHGISGGYLNPRAAVSYDPITQYVLPPNETLVRQSLVSAIVGYPRRILDLGCGTGSTTLLLKQAFPDAEVWGLDLSPYMLVMAEMKAQQTGLEIRWLHGQAEQTPLPDASIDLVTASLLFHETPTSVTEAILAEAYRLLTVGGQVIILDGNQPTLRQVEWLNQVFEEPYIKDYARGSVDAWLTKTGFGAVQTQDYWWIHQVSKGVKPLPRSQNSAPRSVQQPKSPSGWAAPDGIPTPAFGNVFYSHRQLVYGGVLG